MDKEILNKKIQEYLVIIKNDGVGVLFESYDPLDEEGNYLKNKILSQIHFEEGTDLTDEQYKAFIECDSSRKPYFLTKNQYNIMNKVLTRDDPGELTSIYMAAAFKYITTKHDKELNAKLQQDLQDLKNLQELSFFARIKNRKEIKAKKISIEATKRTISDYTEMMERYYPYIENNSIIEQCIEHIEKKHSDTFEKFYTWYEFSYIMGYNICKIAQTLKEDMIDIIDWYNRANGIATAVLTALSLPANLTFDELIESTRSEFSSEHDDVFLSYRTANIPTSIGGGIGAFAAKHTEIDKLMKKMKESFNNAKFEEMSKEEIVEFAAMFSTKFLEIHPYANGNGRTSRMIIDYILTSNGIESPVLYTGIESKLEYGKKLISTRKYKNNDIACYIIDKYAEQFGGGLTDSSNVGV